MDCCSVDGCSKSLSPSLDRGNGWLCMVLFCPGAGTRVSCGCTVQEFLLIHFDARRRPGRRLAVQLYRASCHRSVAGVSSHSLLWCGIVAGCQQFLFPGICRCFCGECDCCCHLQAGLHRPFVQGVRAHGVVWQVLPHPLPRPLGVVVVKLLALSEVQ